MSQFDDDVENEVPDEMASLKQRASLMNIPYHPSISLAKLRDKVNAAVATPVEETPVAKPVNKVQEFNARKRAEAEELVRIRITCMNPAKKEWQGEIITTGNSVVGTHRKFVPFDADAGWHVPRIIYNQLVERQCQVFYTKKNSRGQSTRHGKLIKEFAIEVLPALTPEELRELAEQQALAHAID